MNTEHILQFFAFAHLPEHLRAVSEPFSVYAESIADVGEHRPHAKPTGWLTMLLGNCTRGDVLDVFAGWGSSLIACATLGRVWRGIETR